MAFNDGGHRFWSIDLTTRAGARGAAHTAGTAAFAYAVATFFGAVVGSTILQTSSSTHSSINVVPIALVTLAAFAGFRLQDGKGLVIGAVLAVVVLLDLLAHVLVLQGIPGMVLCAVVLVLLIQGLRGAAALRRGTGFDDDDVGTFG